MRANRICRLGRHASRRKRAGTCSPMCGPLPASVAGEVRGARCPSRSQNTRGEKRMGRTSTSVLCSRNARLEKVWRMGMRSFLCSRSAHDQNVLVRRPQSGLTRVPHQRRAIEQAWITFISSNARTQGSTRPPLREVWDGERRAVKGSFGHSLDQRYEELDALRSTSVGKELFNP